VSAWGWAIGIALGVMMYFRSFALTDRLGRWPMVRPVRAWLAGRMYFDDLYDYVFVGVIRALSAACTAVDRLVIDPIVSGVSWLVNFAGRYTAVLDDAVIDGVVRLISRSVKDGGAIVGLTQGGRVRSYVMAAVVAVILTIGSVVIGLIIFAQTA